MGMASNMTPEFGGGVLLAAPAQAPTDNNPAPATARMLLVKMYLKNYYVTPEAIP
jgi:hypothetical protein